MKLFRMSLFLVASLLGAVMANAREPMTVASWTEDIAFYQSQLEARHIDLYHTVSRGEFERKLGELRAALPNLSDDEIVAALMAVTRLVGDGHTSMPLWNTPQPRFPLEFRSIEGQIVITGAPMRHRDLLGAVVDRWNGIPIEDVYERLSRHVPFVENAGSQGVRVAQYLNHARLSHAIGLSAKVDRLTLNVSLDEERRTVELEAVAPSDFPAVITHRITYRQDLSDDPSLIALDGIRFALLRDGTTGYIQFNRYPSFEQMDAFAGAVTRSLDEAGARALVIDFRENSGGDFFVGLALAANLILLDRLDWKNGVYVLTSGTTFSAAMSNTAQFSEILNARLVGEPTGASPCGYQDMGQFVLPHSGHLVTYSKRRFCFTEPVDDAIAPDVAVTTSRQDYIAGTDPVLDWVFEDISKRETVETNE